LLTRARARTAARNWRQVGLGALGIIAEVTLQCVPAHRLLEHTFVMSAADVRAQHQQLLQENQHMRDMWVPYTDTVVVVTNNPISEGEQPPKVPTVPLEERLAPFRELLRQVQPGVSAEQTAGMSFADYRDALIAVRPLDRAHIAAVNRAEAEFWKRSEVRAPRLRPVRILPPPDNGHWSTHSSRAHPSPPTSGWLAGRATPWAGATPSCNSSAAASSGCRRWASAAAATTSPTARTLSI
jgi:hypothetical protein